MFSTLLVVLPIFALIFAGWAARKIGVLGPHATAELNRFVVYLALPALLFDIIAHTHGADLWQPGFIAAFGLGSGIVFAASAEGQLLALDEKNGKALWHMRLNGPVNSSPITYMAGGKQFLAITASTQLLVFGLPD